MQIVFETYSLLCIYVPCAMYQLYLSRKSTVTAKVNITNLIWRYVMLFYIYMVMYVVGIGTIWDIGKFGSVIRLEEINLIPFRSFGSLTYYLNIIMLMPLGFLLPLIWKRYRSPLQTVKVGFICTLLIELGQLFNRRQTDIDDIITNTLGTLFGYWIWVLFRRFFQSKPKELNRISDDPIIYVLASILTTFFCYNWRWVLLALE